MADDEFTLRKQAERGERAKAIVNDPLVQAAFDNIEADIVKAWQDTNPSDVALRERHHALMMATRLLRDGLQKIISDGKVAQGALNQPKPNQKGRAA